MQKFSALLAAVAASLCLGLPAAAQPDLPAAPTHIAAPEVTANLLSKVDPVYPTEARTAHTEGTVVLDAVISKRGEINRLKVVSGDQSFRASAVEALIQWKFKPYLVDGSPADLETNITVKYRYSGSEEPRVETVLQDAVVVQPRPTPKVSPPIVIYQVEPKFTEAERKAGLNGSALINLWVDDQGNPINVHVLRGTGTALDQKAVEAIKQYRFKPAMENGEPLLVELNITVNVNGF